MKRCLLLLSMISFITSVFAQNLIINEIDADQTSTDNTEFIELYDGGVGNTVLDGYIVVLFNGNGDVSYKTIDLTGHATDANGYFIIGSTGMGSPIEVGTGWLQNGPDAVALYEDDASNFPNGTAVTTNNLVDAIVYDTDDADDEGLLTLLNAGQPQVNENEGGNGETYSLQRFPNGSGGERNTDKYITAAPTPGAPSLPVGTITLTAPNSGTFTNDGDVVTITWNASNVDSVLLLARLSQLQEPFLITEDFALDASLGTFDLPIPDDAEEGSYKFIVMDKYNYSIADSSDEFIDLKDIVFAGLDDNYPFEPQNGATNIPLDFNNKTLRINFDEHVQTGSGYISLYKYDSDELVKEFDVTDPSQVSVDTDEGYNVIINISDVLEPNTKYYILADNGSVMDMASTPNAWEGISDKDTWSFSTETGSITVIYPNGGETFNPKQNITISWSSTNVDSVYILARYQDETELYPLTENPIDALTGNYNFTIPSDAEEGYYKVIITDKFFTVADSSDDFFYVEDNVFAGLSDEYPFDPPNGSTDIPTDLFDNTMRMFFKEPIATGTGYIYLKKYSDDSEVKRFDVTDHSLVYVDPENDYCLLIKLFSFLDPNTQYYVEVESGAIKDQSSAGNEYEGFTGNSTWSFTTGAGNSYIPIHDIQYTTDPSGNSPLNGHVVKIKGVVMYKFYEGGTDYQGFFIQDDVGAWNGIYVSDPDNDDVSVGETATVAGTVAETDGITQITDVLFKYHHSYGGTLYDPEVISLASKEEKYESVLVKVEDVTCTNPDIGDGEWVISDASSNIGVIGSHFYVYSPVQDEAFASITGIYFNEDDILIEPRSADDFEAAPTNIRKTDKNTLSIGPNPVVNTMVISAQKPIARVQIINYVGQTIEDRMVTGERVTVPVNGMTKGIYLVRVSFTDGTVNIRKVIKR